VQAITDKQKEFLCEIIGVDRESYDDHWKMVPKLRDIYATKTFAEWSEIFSKTNLCVERLRHIEEVSSDEQALVNGFIVKYKGDKEKPVSIPMSPIKLNGMNEVLPFKIQLGGDTAGVLKELGYSNEEIARLAENCAIGL